MFRVVAKSGKPEISGTFAPKKTLYSIVKFCRGLFLRRELSFYCFPASLISFHFRQRLFELLMAPIALLKVFRWNRSGHVFHRKGWTGKLHRNNNR